MAAMNQANYSYFVQKDLSSYFAAEYGDFQSMIPALFDVTTPDQAIVYEVLVGDLGSVPVFDGQVSYDDAKQSYRNAIQEIEYALGVKVTKKLRRNDLYGIVREQVQILAQRFRAKRESLAAGVFNNAFTSQLTADALSLCNSAHTSDVGGSSQSNTGTATFSPANVEAARQNMIKFKTNRDNIRVARPSLLLVPTDLHEKAWEIVNSYGKMDTALNNRNFHFGKWNLAVWDNFLTDTNNWFMIDERIMKMVLKYRIWEPVQFFRSGEFDTLVQKYAGYMSNAVSTVEWRWVYGHAVS